MKRLCIAAILALAVAGCSGPPIVHEDELTQTSDSFYAAIVPDSPTMVFTDPKTGCEYLTHEQTGVGFTARMEYRDGNYIHRGCDNVTMYTSTE